MAKVRSPNYPTTDLGAALELVRPAFKAENRNKMSRVVLAKHMGDSTLNGRALTKLGAVRAYGLIEGSSDDLRLSDDAVVVLASPDKVNVSYREALERLAFKPQLFQEIKKQFPATLPSEHNLSFWLVQRRFTEDAAGKAAKSFLATMRLVYNEPEAYNPADELEDNSVVQSMGTSPQPRQGGGPGGDQREIKGDFSVLLQGNRLKINATVDADGIARLKQVLDKYEEILKLLQ